MISKFPLLSELSKAKPPDQFSTLHVCLNKIRLLMGAQACPNGRKLSDGSRFSLTH